MKIINLPKLFESLLNRVPSSEELATLQAMYSRDPGPIVERIQKLQAKGVKNVMEHYYVGYGHDSIGDCGSVTLCFEEVSMLMAKAVQDWPLYNGQESSTRYIDFSNQPFIDPIGTPTSQAHLERWRQFYLKALSQTIEDIKAKHPPDPDKDEKALAAYHNTVKAKAFDIVRAFLPAGASTNLSWHGNLRQTRDKMIWLRNHPDKVMRGAAAEIQSILIEDFPHSGFSKTYEATEAYASEWSDQLLWKPGFACRIPKMKTFLDEEALAEHMALLKKRPAKAPLPPLVGECGSVRFDYVLDYASFRDLQRHRNGVNRIPLLNDDLGFHPWYLGQLNEELEREARGLLKTQALELNGFCDDETIRQYYIPMGYVVPCRIQFPLHAMIYTLDLRTGQTVHPTVREVVTKMYHLFHAALPDIALHVDLNDTNPFNMKRGTQTITEK